MCILDELSVLEHNKPGEVHLVKVMLGGIEVGTLFEEKYDNIFGLDGGA